MADNVALVVIFGINSRQGSSIARRFAHKSHMRLRGITTDLSSTKNQGWKARGVELVQIKDFRDTGAIEEALQGAVVIFAFTDFYRYLDEHSTLSLASMYKKCPEEVAAQREILEGKAIIAAAADVPSLQLFVLSSLSPLSEETEVVRGLQQFRSKAEIAEYMDSSHEELAKKASLLKPALYMENWTMFLRKNANGRFTFGTTLPADLVMPWTNVTNDMGTLFQLCTASVPPLNIAALSDIKSGAEICQLFTSTTGIPCDYVQYTAEELVKMLGSRGHIIVDMLNHLSQRLYYEEDGIQLSHHVIKGRPDAHRFHLTSFEEYMKATLPAHLGLKEDKLGNKEATRASDSDVGIAVYDSGARATSEDARMVSEQMAAKGFEVPKMKDAEGRVTSGNGWDRNE